MFGEKLVSNKVYFSIATLAVVFFTVTNNINATTTNFDFTNRNGETDIWNIIILLGVIYTKLAMFYLLGQMSDLFWERNKKKLLH